MVKKERKKNKRKGKTSFIIIDAQSVKNSDTAKQKGYDAGKKVSGIKRHIAVDSQGLPMQFISPLPISRIQKVQNNYYLTTPNV